MGIALELLSKVEGLHQALNAMGIVLIAVGAGVQATATLISAAGVQNAFLVSIFLIRYLFDKYYQNIKDILIALDNHVPCTTLILIHIILGTVSTTAAPTTPTLLKPTTEKGIKLFNTML